jgi:hypothetical protein
MTKEQQMEKRIAALETEIRELQAFCGVLGPVFEKQLAEQRGLSLHEEIEHHKRARRNSEGHSASVDARIAEREAKSRR